MPSFYLASLWGGLQAGEPEWRMEEQPRAKGIPMEGRWKLPSDAAARLKIK